MVDLRGMTTEGLSRYVQNLDREEARLTMWESLANHELGKFFLEELTTRRDLARNLYGEIDASHSYRLYHGRHLRRPPFYLIQHLDNRLFLAHQPLQYHCKTLEEQICAV